MTEIKVQFLPSPFIIVHIDVIRQFACEEEKKRMKIDTQKTLISLVFGKMSLDNFKTG